MPPTPFRPPSSRPGARSQFASTPRFLLSQTPTSSRATQHVDAIDEESPQSTPIPTAKRNREPPHQQKDVIEDSDEPDEHEPHRSSIDTVGLDSSPPEGVGAGSLDAEYEALFGPISDRAKRRRVSPTTETPLLRKSTDFIISSSPDPPSPTADRPAHRSSTVTPSQAQGPRPRPSAVAETPRPLTPGSAAFNPTPRNQPRFLLASQALPSTQPSATATPRLSTQVPTSPRRRPAFVLPRSPSPGNEDTSIPTPFSPSSRALRRRGRYRSTPSYLPDGMASEVRGWILEMGMKRDPQDNPGPGPAGSTDLGKYPIAVRVEAARRSGIGGTGCQNFVRGEVVHGSDSGDGSVEGGSGEMKNVLLLGGPRLNTGPVPELQAGCVIGICRGLVWDIELGKESLPMGCDEDESPAGDEQTLEKWLVSVEWDLIPQ